MTPQQLIDFGFSINHDGHTYSKYEHGFSLSVAIQRTKLLHVRLCYGVHTLDATGSCYAHLREALKLDMKNRLLTALDKLETLK